MAKSKKLPHQTRTNWDWQAVNSFIEDYYSDKGNKIDSKQSAMELLAESNNRIANLEDIIRKNHHSFTINAQDLQRLMEIHNIKKYN